MVCAALRLPVRPYQSPTCVCCCFVQIRYKLGRSGFERTIWESTYCLSSFLIQKEQSKKFFDLVFLQLQFETKPIKLDIDIWIYAFWLQLSMKVRLWFCELLQSCHSNILLSLPSTKVTLNDAAWICCWFFLLLFRNVFRLCP